MCSIPVFLHVSPKVQKPDIDNCPKIRPIFSAIRNLQVLARETFKIHHGLSLEIVRVTFLSKTSLEIYLPTYLSIYL